jgi:antitoxin (DNA-binding transcriptional repressor) of toxin-antitoxin stability system
MYHMKRASVRDLRYDFNKVERLLRQGEEVQVTKRRKVIARLIPENLERHTAMPDFLGRLQEIYGGNVLSITGADLIADDRKRY